MLQFTVIGNLGGDAELHNENGSSYISFKVAHNERFTKSDGSQVDKTLWVSCILNGEAANLRQYLTKGQLVFVSGDGDVRTYHSQVQRQMVAGVNIRVRQIQLLGAKSDGLPNYVIDNNGAVHNVIKHIRIEAKDLAEVHDRAGNRFNVDDNGWLISVPPTTNGQQENQPAADDNLPW